MNKDTHRRELQAGPTTGAKAWYVLTCVTAFAHFLVTAVLSLTRLYTYKATLLDLGLVDQAIWNTAKYGAPITTVSVPYAPYNWLGFHFSPIVLALVAVYRWIPKPELLIILQTLLISASTILIFRTCVALLKKPGQAYSWGVLFLLNPFIWNGAVWDFHEKSFAVPAFSLAYYALVFKRRALFVIALAALVLTQEHYGLAVAGFGTLWAFYHSERGFGVYTAAAGILCTAVVIFVVMPALNPAGSHPMMVDQSGPVLGRYAWLKSPLVQRGSTFLHIVPGGLVYLLFLFLPTGRASLLAPMFLLPGIADLMANLLSLNPMPRSILAYHSMALVPGFIVAAVAASSSRPAQSAAFIRLSLLTTVFLTYFYLPAPAPGAYNVWQIHSLRLKRDPPIAEIHALINPDLKLSVQSNVGSFFSQRRYVYPFPAKLEDVDAVVVQFAYPYDSVDYVPFGIPYGRDEMRQVLQAMNDLVNNRDFGLIYWQRNWLCARRGAEDRVDREAVRRALNALNSRFDAVRPAAGP